MLSKPITRITVEDLTALVDEGAVENLRLEFKTEIPAKQETLKKFTSFANTYGGYLIIGAYADGSDGRLIDLPGVDLQPNYKQRVVQWCFDAVDPPLTVEVSDPISIPGGSDRVCYVAYVPESNISPHFIHGRKGIYIRTDEYSQRYEPRLATQSELVALFDRRKQVTDRRVSLTMRAHQRFDSFAETRYPDLGGREEGVGARFSLAIVPRFPSEQVVGLGDVLPTLREINIPWRQVGFPRTTQGFVTQHESGSDYAQDQISHCWSSTFGVYCSTRAKSNARRIHILEFTCIHFLVISWFFFATLER